MTTPTDPGDRRPALSQRAKVGLSVVAGALVLWFLFAWIVLDRAFIDAAGESVGTAFLLGVVASFVGAMRGSRGG